MRGLCTTQVFPSLGTTCEGFFSLRRHWCEVVVVLVGLLLWGGCNEPLDPPALPTFEQPSDMTFSCQDAAGGLVDLSFCEEVSDENFSLLSFVTQESPGEVAALNLRTNRVVDTDFRVPGFTFAQVGERPVAIVSNGPSMTYVANAGTFEVMAISAQRYLVSNRDLVPFQSVRLSSGPRDLVLGPEGARLFATLPDEGLLAIFSVAADLSLGEPTYIELNDGFSQGPDAQVREEYCKVCDDGVTGCGGFESAYDDGLDEPLPFLAREPVALEDSPRPTELVLDRINGRLLVADEALPKIHVFDINAGELQPLSPLFPGVPVSSLALTPPVPPQVGSVDATEVFLYAIDATDQSVLVLDYNTGAVLPVSVRPDRDRDRLVVPRARDLEVFTLDYPGGEYCVDGGAFSEDSEQFGARQFRGVFLAVVGTLGSVFVVDVHDLNATCRGGNLQCVGAGSEEESRVFIKRHRTRLLTQSLEGNVILRGMNLTVNGVAFSVGNSGTTLSTTAPTLQVFPGGCGVGDRVAFPLQPEGERLLCVYDDPWSSFALGWRLTYEGAIAGSAGGRGRFDGPTVGTERVRFVSDVPLCDVGVLGRENAGSVPPSEPEAGYSGDLLVLFPVIDDTTSDECRGLFDVEDQVLDFPVLRSSDGALEISATTRGGIRHEQLIDCFGDSSWIHEIRVQDAYSVFASGLGFLHRVTTGGAGVCEVDLSLPATQQGRLFHDRVFDNGFINLQVNRPSIVDAEGMPIVYPFRGEEVRLSFDVGTPPSPMTLSVGELPGRAIFEPTLSNLYTLDDATGRLSRFGFQPLESLQSIE